MLRCWPDLEDDLLCCQGRRKDDTQDDLEDIDEAKLEDMPPSLREIVDDSMRRFQRIKDNAEWTLCASRPGFKVFSCPYPDQAFLYWKVEVDSVRGTRDRIAACVL